MGSSDLTLPRYGSDFIDTAMRDGISESQLNGLTPSTCFPIIHVHFGDRFICRAKVDPVWETSGRGSAW